MCLYQPKSERMYHHFVALGQRPLIREAGGHIYRGRKIHINSRFVYQ